MRVLLVLLVFVAIASCCNNYDKYMKLFCKYGSETNPCTIEHQGAFKSACCSLPGRCSFSEFPKDQVCCFSQSCLDRCYPGKRYQLGSVY